MKQINKYVSRARIEPKLIVKLTIERIDTTPASAQKIETMFLIFLCLSNAENKKPTIGINRIM